jgi:hypothetical protein
VLEVPRSSGPQLQVSAQVSKGTPRPRFIIRLDESCFGDFGGMRIDLPVTYPRGSIPVSIDRFEYFSPEADLHGLAVLGTLLQVVEEIGLVHCCSDRVNTLQLVVQDAPGRGEIRGHLQV